MNTSTYQSPIERIQIGSCSVAVIGTAHVSKESADEVSKLISEEKPDCVCVELCDQRLETIQDPDRWKKTDIFTIIKTGKTLLLFAQLILGSFQKRLAKKLDIEPGAEMKIAIDRAQESGAILRPIDRNIRITLRRTWANMSGWTITKLIFSSLTSYSDGDSIEIEDIEKLKGKDALTVALEEFSQGLPEVKETLIDERDLFMARKIRAAALEGKHKHMIAVVGAGHLPGMIDAFKSEETDVSALEVIPPSGIFWKAVAWAIPVSLILALVYSLFVLDAEQTINFFSMWLLLTSGFSAVGALLAWAHPLSILSAAIAAPIAAMHPAIATGWVSGLVEAWLRKPQVADFEQIADDLSTFSGFWNNRVTRIILVVGFSNLGCIAGQFLSLYYIGDKLI